MAQTTTTPPSVSVTDRRSPYVIEDWRARTFRVNREVFRSEEIFARYMSRWRDHVFDLASSIRQRGQSD